MLSEMHALLHTFHALSIFFTSEVRLQKLDIEQSREKKTPWNTTNRSVSNIRPSTSQFAYASSSPSPTCVAFCCCQKGSWSMWGSSSYSLPSSRFLSMPHLSHLFLSPICPFSLPEVATAKAAFSPLYCFSAGWESTAGKQELLGENISSRE